MEDENNNMFDLDNVNLTNSEYDLPQEQEEVIGIDVYDLNNKKWEYEFDLNKKTGDFLQLCLNDLGIQDPRHEIIFFLGKTKQYLDNQKTLAQNGIESLDQLYLRKKENAISNNNSNFQMPVIDNKDEPIHSNTIHIYMGESYDKMEEFNVDPNISVGEVLNIYKTKVAIKDTASVFVTFKGQILKSDKKLSEVGIANGDKINILVRLKGGYYY